MALNEKQLEWVDQEILTPVVRNAIHDSTCVVDSWTVEPIQSGAGNGLGIYRVRGQGHGASDAEAAGAESAGGRSWSVILKRMGPNENDSQEIGAWNYWRREVHAYHSGLLENLPGGVTAPRCLGMDDRPDGSACLWLEDLSQGTLVGPPWPPETYRRAAYHLGLLNGAFLTGRPRPSAPWLSQGWVKGWVDQAAPAIQQLRGLLDHPLARKVYPPPVADAIFKLWNARSAIYSVLDRLPQTFCHMDAFSRNLFLRELPGGVDEIVALDWAFTGTGALGEELVSLAAGSFIFTTIGKIPAQDLFGLSLEGYLAGLREAGWHGNPRLIEFVYDAVAPLRYLVSIVRVGVMDIQNEDAIAPLWETIMGRPWKQIQLEFQEFNALMAAQGMLALDQLPDYL